MGSVRTPEEEEADGTASAGKSYPHFPSSSSSSSSSSSAAAAAAPPRRWQNDSHNSSRFHNDYSIHHHPPPPSPYHYERRVRETVINGTTWYPQLPRSGPNPRYAKTKQNKTKQYTKHTRKKDLCITFFSLFFFFCLCLLNIWPFMVSSLKTTS
mgnify:CR=1 FL=1